MRSSLLASGLLIFTVPIAGQNSCLTALPIGPGTHVVSGIDGAAPPPLSCGSLPGGGSPVHAEWYSFTTTTTTGVTISTVASGVNTRFQVYSGVCGALTCVTGDDDSGPGSTWVASFNAQGGVTYIIAFDNLWTPPAFSFGLSMEGPIEGRVTWEHEAPPGLVGHMFGIVDMNGDHLDDIVAPVDGAAPSLHILHQVANGFSPMNHPLSGPVQQSIMMSLAVGDIDGNGHNDVLYGGSPRTTSLMANDAGTGFTEVLFPEWVEGQRGNLVDVNNDGHLDAFVSNVEGANKCWLNDGDGNLSFAESGLGNTCGNWGSIWTDYDGDGDQDLFVAKSGGCDAVDILMRNNGDGTFTNVAAELSFADDLDSWSSAWGDFDNDLDMDVCVGANNIGEHKLMRNNGDGSFTDVVQGSGLDDPMEYEAEWVAHDFNNDGRLDLMSGNQIHYGNGDLTFTQDYPVVWYGPLSGGIGDLNNDGFLDMAFDDTVAWNSGNASNWLTVATIGTVSNVNGIGARIILTTPTGQQVREIRSGEGWRCMSSLNAHFGIRTDTEVISVEVHWPSGIVDVIEDPAINGTLVVVEGLHTGMHEAASSEMTLYPNPAIDALTVIGPAAWRNASVQVFDATGKQVMRTTLRNGQVDVSMLSSGAYVLNVAVDGTVVSRKFTKR